MPIRSTLELVCPWDVSNLLSRLHASWSARLTPAGPQTLPGGNEAELFSTHETRFEGWFIKDIYMDEDVMESVMKK